ncbi:cysteine desulfurase [Bacillus sp. OxB-1]|uniref:cysteine desulfurase-like protein n=1 Tax=Bacillus sp. (strain OxB-1) TaxID=98228 RepID=UPI000581D816|nr:cysteine desulfurase-like protein [Bacillus sp. OxB-1]BAQ09979.1 cysteine desulfurase [Bacillus sp. OxB-1]
MKERFPIEYVRSKFPAVDRNDEQLIYFDGPGGTQMVKYASEKMFNYISNGMANLHGTFLTSVRTEEIIEETRNSVSDLLACSPTEVAFGANMTSLAFSISRSLGFVLEEEDEIVVTEIDHRANVDPWIHLAREKGAKVKFIEVSSQTYSLNLDDLDNVITEKTKLVAVSLSSNVTGTVTDINIIAKRAKEVGALLIVDAVHAVPHMAIDFKQLKCDILFCSAYKFFGPHLGIAVIKEDLFEKLPVFKLEPAPTEIPWKLETGTQNHEGIAGLSGAINFIEQLGKGATRRQRLISGIEEIDTYEISLAGTLENFLKDIPDIQLYRSPDHIKKTSTIAFTIKNQNSRNVTKWFAEHYNVCVADGDFYASTMAEKLGVYPLGGWVRVGFAPYNTIEEVELFKEGMTKFIESRKLMVWQ